MMLTAGGIEGGAVYALSAPLREALEGAAEPVFLHLDLKPQMDRAALERKLQRRRNGRSLASFLAGELRLPAIAYPLLREVADPLPQDAAKLAALIKHVPLRILRARPIAEAISSAGGIAFDALDDNLMLRAMPGVFAAGEMLDWEAPTGGYLLQGCMSSAVVAAEGVLDWLRAT
jgi:predicted flavoprotein YhiN